MDETRCQKIVTPRQEGRCHLFHTGKCRCESERESAGEASINPRESANIWRIGGASGVALWNFKG